MRTDELRRGTVFWVKVRMVTPYYDGGIVGTVIVRGGPMDAYEAMRRAEKMALARRLPTPGGRESPSEVAAVSAEMREVG